MDINSLQQLNQILSSTKFITSDAQLASYATLLNQIKADTINDNLTAPSNSKSLSQTGVLSLLQGYINSQQLNNTLLNLLATSTTRGLAYLNNPISVSNNVSNPNTHVDFSAGNALLRDGSGQILLASTLVKRLDATWAEGTGNGGLFNGTAVPKAINTWYYIFTIVNTTTGATDAGFDASVSGANVPSGWKISKILHAIKTDGTGNILQGKFYSDGWFYYNSEQGEYQTNATTAGTFINLSFAPKDITSMTHLTAVSVNIGTQGNRDFRVGISANNGRLIGGSISYGDTYITKDGGQVPTTLSGGNPQVYTSSSGSGVSILRIHGFKLI